MHIAPQVDIVQCGTTEVLQTIHGSPERIIGAALCAGGDDKAPIAEVLHGLIGPGQRVGRQPNLERRRVRPSVVLHPGESGKVIERQRRPVFERGDQLLRRPRERVPDRRQPAAGAPDGEDGHLARRRCRGPDSLPAVVDRVDQ